VKVFIWERVEQVSSSWHSGGGLVVFAATEERARAIANATDDVKVAESDKVDEVRESSGEEAVFTFPDAGCC
jgi:hypothetical protein